MEATELLLPFVVAAIVTIVVGGVLLEVALRLLFGKPTQKNVVRNNTVVYYISAKGTKRQVLPGSPQSLPSQAAKGNGHANPFTPKYAPIPVEAHRAAVQPDEMLQDLELSDEEDAEDEAGDVIEGIPLVTPPPDRPS